ncbi:hypothetical protein [Bifidobacterium sp. SO1]|uniref:hypothetical protein n=1 Tax=Bifidobacterium sp. SO1 TaxID=2809029 RepID=UPI001BDD2E73|nr:hypothetical protein [Bifidobacterium sp. SO1]MBT1161251.1 hypothetical protein [Bifidobacterium sp. SO1]
MSETSQIQTTAPRICAYATCWREVVTDAPSPLIGVIVAENKSLMCMVHERQVRDEFDWLARNLDDLEHYRINRAYGHGEGAGGSSGTAPAPLRETLSDLLYRADDQGYPGLQPTLYEWARSLALNVPAACALASLTHRLRTCYRLMENPATPVYARQLHEQVTRLRRFLEPDDGKTVILGPCPAKDCGTPLSGRMDAKDVQCPHCHSRWATDYLIAQRRERILRSPKLGTQSELTELLKACGVHVNKTTMRSWVHRGQLPQAGENECSKPVYRLADAYRLATEGPTPPTTPSDNIWQTINTKE